MTTPTWDDYFLGLAKETSRKSRDPSTQVGAVITDAKNRIVSIGFNGLPRGIPDKRAYLHNRALKLKLILHAEMNALLFAQRDLADCTIYTWPLPPCAHCTSAILQAGITRIVAPSPSPEHRERWGEDLALSGQMVREAGIIRILKELPIG